MGKLLASGSLQFSIKFDHTDLERDLQGRGLGSRSGDLEERHPMRAQHPQACDQCSTVC